MPSAAASLGAVLQELVAAPSISLNAGTSQAGAAMIESPRRIKQFLPRASQAGFQISS